MNEQFNGIVVYDMSGRSSIPVKASELYKMMGSFTIVFLAKADDGLVNVRAMKLISTSSISRTGVYAFGTADGDAYEASTGDQYPVLK